MNSEQPLETSLVPGGETVVSFQQTKPGSEQVRFAGPVSLLGVGGVAVLFVPGSVLGRTIGRRGTGPGRDGIREDNDE